MEKVMAGVRPRHVLCRPSLKGSPTPPNVGVENVPNFFSVHLTGSGGAICQPGARTRCRPDKKNWRVESPEVEDGADDEAPQKRQVGSGALICYHDY